MLEFEMLNIYRVSLPRPVAQSKAHDQVCQDSLYKLICSAFALLKI